MTTSLAPRLHHVAIQTNDFGNCVAWYEEMLGCRVSWTLSEFSSTTRSRLPGIVRLAELEAGDMRFHIFERACGLPPTRPTQTEFQHICLEVSERAELERLRDRWFELFRSGRFSYVEPTPEPTEIETSTRTTSFYALDVNGLEFEFMHEDPPAA